MCKPVPRLHVILALCFLVTSAQSTATTSPSSISWSVIRNWLRLKPNIIIILADDLGWNDVSFHGSNQIPTPNIDALAYNGIILNQHYVPALCTPSRAALLTGKLPIYMGMQHSVILGSEPRGLPLEEKLLPEYLKKEGYKTHAIGKWHLGYHEKKYTPTYRGFDSHFGYWNPLKDYYSHMVRETTPELFHFYGFDMRRNMSIAWDTKGKYTTDLFTDEAVRLISEHDRDHPMFMYLAHLAVHSGNVECPLQAPEEEVAKFSHINDHERRIYAAMVSKLDESVGKVVTALKNHGMLENSVILFMTDNGAPSSGFLANHGSNYPLRGMKDSPWEGGTRGIAAIWSPLIKNSRRVSNQMIYMTDWFPTFLSIAGVTCVEKLNTNGENIWPSLDLETRNPREHILVNIDDRANYSAIRSGDFKYVNGMTSRGSKWEGESGTLDDEAEEDTSPPYDPEKVLHSEVGLAISELVTIRQCKKNEEKVNSSKNGMTLVVEEEILTPALIEKLRNNATVKCNVKEEDKIPCDPLKAPCLFNITHDPCEMVNLADAKPEIVHEIEKLLVHYQKTMSPSANVERDLRADPAHWNNTWTSWRDPHFIAFNRIEHSRTIVMVVVLGTLLVIVTIIFRIMCRRRIVSQYKVSSSVSLDTNSCAS